MTQQDGMKLLSLINTFLNEEENQKLTRWAIIGFGTIIEKEINKIVLKDKIENEPEGDNKIDKK